MANQFTVLPMPQAVIDRIHSIADAQRMPTNTIFTDVEGHIVDDYGSEIVPLDNASEDNRSVHPADHAARLYMGIHNPPERANDPNANSPPPEFHPNANGPPPEFQLHSADAGIDALLDDNYFLPLAQGDDDDSVDKDGMIGVADDIVGDVEVSDVEPPAWGHRHRCSTTTSCH